MNWEALAAISQMLGSVAVFVTLVYLALKADRALSDDQQSPAVLALTQSAGLTSEEACRVQWHLSGRRQVRFEQTVAAGSDPPWGLTPLGE